MWLSISVWLARPGLPTSTSHLTWFFSLDNTSITFKVLWTYLRHISSFMGFFFHHGTWYNVFLKIQFLLFSRNFYFVLSLNIFSILHMEFLTSMTQIIFALVYSLLCTYVNLLFFYIHHGYLKPSFFLSNLIISRLKLLIFSVSFGFASIFFRSVIFLFIQLCCLPSLI